MSKPGPTPKPWKRMRINPKTGKSEIQGWYCTIDGRQHPLGKDRQSAHREFFRMMAAHGQAHEVSARITIDELAAVWLDDCQGKKSAPTMKTYTWITGEFAKNHGRLQIRDLKPFHVSNWIESRRWSSSTANCAVGVLKAMVNWGSRQGYFDGEPLRRLPMPPMQRRRPVSIEDAASILAMVNPSLKIAIRLLMTSGLRPGELCSLVAEKIDLDSRFAIVKGKSGIRRIALSKEAVEILTSLMAGIKSGPVVRGYKRKAVTVSGLESAVRRARRRAAVAMNLDAMAFEHVKTHCFRGLFATEAIRRGVDTGLVSQLLGHKDSSILFKHYANFDERIMLTAIDHATLPGDETPDSRPDPSD